jgi:hypothetical protein
MRNVCGGLLGWDPSNRSANMKLQTKASRLSLSHVQCRLWRRDEVTESITCCPYNMYKCMGACISYRLGLVLIFRKSWYVKIF